MLNTIDFKSKKVVLLTTHKRENWVKSIENIFKAMIKLIQENKRVEFIFSIYKNLE